MASIIKHTLALDVPFTACTDILRISDASVYGLGLETECLKLEVLVPGFSDPAVFTDTDDTPLAINFDNRYSANQLKLSALYTSELLSLPDGVYTIRYSLAPNDKVNVKYYHLRVTTILNDYYLELARIQLATGEATAELKQKLADLRYIKSLIDAAVAKVEYCHSITQGTDMYNYANTLLTKYKSGVCITCN